MKSVWLFVVLAAITGSTPGYHRPEESTYLTFPEWFIVYGSQEYADFLADHPPSGFPYFQTIQQFWSSYYRVYQVTKDHYGFNLGDHAMLWVIGVSYSVENAIKGVYENTIGRFTEWTAGGERTEEDALAHQINTEYADFIYDRPWYEFSFATALQRLWSDTSLSGPHLLRKWERKCVLNLEFAVKTVYGWLIGLGTHATYGTTVDTIQATVTNLTDPPADVIVHHPALRVVRSIGSAIHFMELPRYRAFSEVVPALTYWRGAQFHDIAGNDDLFLTVIAPRGWDSDFSVGMTIFTMPLLTHSAQQRVGIQVPVRDLHTILLSLRQSGVALEHLYDY